VSRRSATCAPSADGEPVICANGELMTVDRTISAPFVLCRRLAGHDGEHKAYTFSINTLESCQKDDEAAPMGRRPAPSVIIQDTDGHRLCWGDPGDGYAWRESLDQVDVFDTKAEAVEMRRGAMPRVRGISVVPLTEAEAELDRQARSRWRLRTWRGWLTG
jgi:hypothetical protein